jgi:Apea-like HEPN
MHEFKAEHMADLIIAKEKRFVGLKKMLFAFAKSLKNALATTPNLIAVPQRDAFWALCLPWIIELEIPNAQSQLLNQVRIRKAEILLAGFEGDKAVEELVRTKAADSHLAECCPSLALLARHFSRNFISEALPFVDSETEGTHLEELYQSFEVMTYEQGPFRRSSFTHVFNLEIDGRDLDIGDIRIIRLSPDFKGIVLGEQTQNPFLHPPGLGDCFIYSNEGASPENDESWLQARRSVAYQFVMVLQYFKSGLVHIGYTSYAFQPQWTHQIRREGLYFIGDPRRIPYQGGQALYKIDSQDLEPLAKYWNAMKVPTIANAINDRSSKLRQAILRAGEYYEKSHETVDAPERLINLAVALEALYSPDNQEQLRFRISLAAAQFLGSDPDSKKKIFDTTQELYSRRSKIVHGGYDVTKYMAGTLVTLTELDAWSDLVRSSVLGFFVLALRGETDRLAILRQLELSAFDNSRATLLQQRSNLPAYLAEEGLM